MSNTVFEEVGNEHLQCILDIYNYYVLNTTVTFHEDALSIDEMKELVVFDSAIYKTFVIKQDETVCGYVILTRYKNRKAYDGTAEVTVYLKPDSIGRGIGSGAVKFIESYARSKNIHVLMAIICEENDKSIILFEHNGYAKCAHFREVGKKFGRLLDVVAYQKILDE